METYLIWIWLGLTVLFVVFELVTTSLTTIWFAGGGLVAFILAILKTPWWAQVIAFIVVSVVLLIFTRPVLTKLLKVGNTKTNVDSLVGQRAKVLVDIDNAAGIGYAIVGGQDWSARSEDDAVVIPKGSEAIIVGISGVKLILRPIDKE